MAERYTGLLYIDEHISHFAIATGRKWFGLARRFERWYYEFAPDCEIPPEIRGARDARDARQAFSMYEVDIDATLGEPGHFGPQGWCCRIVTIHRIPRVGRCMSTIPGSFLRKLWGLPPDSFAA
jgi:hypothetical protein